MHVVLGYPPLLDLIDRTFNVCGRPVIFAWGDKIFNPRGIALPEHLLAHERVHGTRQARDIEGWWRRYCEDRQFRLAEEIPAHRAEFRSLLGSYGDVRENRRRFLALTAAKLANPLYGKLISVAEAKNELAA